MLRKNPIKVRREQLNYSINQLEYQSGIHRQVIIRAEQGCYAKIPPRLLSYLLARTGDGTPHLTNDYIAWVAEKRRDSFGKLPEQLPPFVEYRHPFIHWRQEAELSRAAVCTYFCINLATLARFERQYLICQSVPQQLVTALVQSGYSGHLINELRDQYDLYRNLQAANISGDETRAATCRNEIDVYLNTAHNGDAA